ncbi:Post-GPI attachment to protein factor 2 isoform X2 [Fasciolopsis buskii]|uniref:Post-GPI attachment to protein factor 2 isoform X2 n=1 Tax=Fasciolopsis buskii TaxID=27845 RepID=A0A8E0RUQ3_9TREM|nr:Post-GPI attachment to protein factor 2 isoform X2 [Fasciolopsis buski]
MWLCTVSSVFFFFEEVTESVCGVSNFIPSISAATGITPQLYFWRYAIGFHSAPRILLAAAYYQHYKSFVKGLSCTRLYDILTKVALILNMVDVFTFVGVAFISNRENFPFSWFSATEYGIAVANMGFHLTAAYDFQDVMLTTATQKSHLD